MTETLEKQFELVKKETKTSHVLHWGELSLSKMKVGEFVGTKQSPSSNYGPFEDISDPCLVSVAGGGGDDGGGSGGVRLQRPKNKN